MHPTVEKLLIVQERDQKLRDHHKELTRLPVEEEQARARLADDTAAVQAAKKAIQENEIAMKNFELDIDTRKNTIIRLKKQQFETRKNEEYQALGHEIVRYEKEADDLETRELELMEEMDVLRAALKSAEAVRAHTRTLVDEDLASIAERRQRLEAEHAEVAAERESLAAKLDDTILPLYERLMKSKAGLALAPMHEGKCQGCHMKLIPSTVVSVQTGHDLARCEDCGRILYLEA